MQTDISSDLKNAAKRIIDIALQEDIGSGDITTRLLVPADMHAKIMLMARTPLVAAGVFVLPMVFDALGAGVHIEYAVADGTKLKTGEVLAELSGPADYLLTGERVALNMLQRLCGVATLTAEYVNAIHGTHAIILDTRKTIPGWRLLDKYAVTCGGGENHRTGLYDMILIKDNHVALCGGVRAAIEQARAESKVPMMVECDSLEQMEEALQAGAPRILLDNMSIEQLKQAVRLNKGRAKLEASGGVNLKTVRAIAETGIDYISVGAITHSAIAADIGADIVLS